MTDTDTPCEHRWGWMDGPGVFLCVRCGAVEDPDAPSKGEDA